MDISYDGGTDFGGGGSSDDSDSGMAMMAPGWPAEALAAVLAEHPPAIWGGGSLSGGEAPGGSPGGEMPSGDGGGMPDMGSFFRRTERYGRPHESGKYHAERG